MAAQQIDFLREQPLAVRYRSVVVGWHRPDFIVEDKVVVELKAVSRIDAVFTKQLLTYLKVSGLHVGLLVNFDVPSMANGGIRRLVL